MKTFIREVGAEHLPYIILWLILFLFSLLMLSSFLFAEKEDLSGQASQYAQGYFIRSRASGSVRIIPYAGTSFKSPVSNTIKAVISPYIEEEDERQPARQKSGSY